MSDGADIRPAPTSEEAAAIAAVLRLLRRSNGPVPVRAMSGWQRAARREGLRTELTHETDGWERAARNDW